MREEKRYYLAKRKIRETGRSVVERVKGHLVLTPDTAKVREIEGVIFSEGCHPYPSFN